MSLSVFFYLLLCGLMVASDSDVVVIRGTPSMLLLGQQLIALYKNDLPNAKIAINVADSVQSLPPGGNAIWQTVRQLDKTQREHLQQCFGSTAQEIPIAVEGVVVIVNRHNPIADLTVPQLRSIYLGQTTNWKEVGGRDAAIRLYSTEALVGGSLFFTDLVLHGEDIDTTMRGFASPKETERAVAADANGIGLIPIRGENDVTYPLIHRSAENSGVEASIENIRTLKYPLSSKVYWVIAGQHTAAVSDLVRFTLSPRGQLAAEASGYYPLNPAERSQAMMLASHR
jgi:phosphate transport system substrate-binding protein